MPTYPTASLNFSAATVQHPFVPGHHRKARRPRIDRMVQWGRIPQGTAVTFPPEPKRLPKSIRRAMRKLDHARRVYRGRQTPATAAALTRCDLALHAAVSNAGGRK